VTHQFRARLERRDVAGDAGRIDQTADRTEALDDDAEGTRDLVLVGDVGFQEQRALVGERVLGIGERVAAGVDDRDRPAVLQQPPGNRQADAGGAAGDDRRVPHLIRSRIDT
jgi:hypothetical protein